MPPTPSTSTAKLRLVCISDTHNTDPSSGAIKLPPLGGDILIHAGDLTNSGSPGEITKTLAWLGELTCKFRKVLVVAGNHDGCLEAAFDGREGDGGGEAREAVRRLCGETEGLVFLEHDEGVRVLQLAVPGGRVEVRVWGSPLSPARSGAGRWAFQYPEAEAEGVWDRVPTGLDLMVTHTPPKGLCDRSGFWGEGGCGVLRGVLGRVRPRVLVCGHCHEGRGAVVVRWGDRGEVGEVGEVVEWEDPGVGNKRLSVFDLTGKRGGVGLRKGEETVVVNASVMAKSFGRGRKEYNKPIVVDIDLPVIQVDSE
ncbi:hypothetical protein MBLNU230_g0301t1 [Neophaeotheca triangularis]